jgi:hypothetical protein
MRTREKTIEAEGATALNLVPVVDIGFPMLLLLTLGAGVSRREFEALRFGEVKSVKAGVGSAHGDER